MTNDTITDLLFTLFTEDITTDQQSGELVADILGYALSLSCEGCRCYMSSELKYLMFELYYEKGRIDNANEDVSVITERCDAANEHCKQNDLTQFGYEISILESTTLFRKPTPERRTPNNRLNH